MLHLNFLFSCYCCLLSKNILLFCVLIGRSIIQCIDINKQTPVMISLLPQMLSYLLLFAVFPQSFRPLLLLCVLLPHSILGDDLLQT